MQYTHYMTTKKFARSPFTSGYFEWIGEEYIDMIFEAKKITLKDGRAAVLKTPCIEDAEKMLNFIKRSSGETDFLLRYPEEWDRWTVESEEQWVNSMRSSPNIIGIACYVDGEIAGNCEISFRGEIKTAHRATVAIAVLKKYWNLGIGSVMISELLCAVEARPDTEIVELEFLEGNDRAKALYEKYGFKIVGERPNAFKLKDGRLLKEYFMQKELNNKRN